MPGGRRLYRIHAVIALLAALGLPAQAAGADPQTFMVPMSDGVRLATDVYLPAGEGPWPVVLARTPYGRFAMDDLTSRGYVVVTQDWRGYFGSEGVKLSFETEGWGEHRDGYDTVQWIAAQAFCDGKVGTWGGSALGITQNLMAGSYPENLVCQHILAGASDLYSQLVFQGGALRKSMVEGWWAVHGRLEHLQDLLSHPNYDQRWELLNSERRAPGMEYPAIHVGGWYDIFCQGIINAFEERQYNGGPGSRGNQRLVMGPWWHGGFNLINQGELAYPPSSIYSSIWTDSYKLYDFWLKGMDSGWGEMPVVRYYVMGDVDDAQAPGNEWRTADGWPVPHSNLSLCLSEEGLVDRAGEGSAQSYLYDPEDPVPTRGGANLVLEGGPVDQRAVEDRDDVLVFSTQPLEVPVEITGRVYAQLFASSSCPDTDFTAKLTDVYPDGRSMLVADGIIRARHRNSMEYEELMEQGEVYEFWVDLWSTSIVFDKGHRIRLAISSSNFPRFDANPNNGEPFGSGGAPRVANNTIHLGGEYPSRLLLPLAGPDSDGDGVYDLRDPFPGKAGPLPGADVMLSLADDLESRVLAMVDRNAAEVLLLAVAGVRERIAEDDLGGAGHLIDISTEALGYDPGNITDSDAMDVVEAATARALASAREGNYLDMLDCLKAGYSLGSVVEGLQGHDASQVLRAFLDKALLEFNSKGCRDGQRLVEWLGLDGVIEVAAGIQRARLAGVPEGDLAVIQGMLESSKDQYLEQRVQGALSMIANVRRRLENIRELCFPMAPLLAMLLSIPALLHARKSPLCRGCRR
jgi:predicted acyl esterase